MSWHRSCSRRFGGGHASRAAGSAWAGAAIAGAALAAAVPVAAWVVRADRASRPAAAGVPMLVRSLKRNDPPERHDIITLRNTAPRPAPPIALRHLSLLNVSKPAPLAHAMSDVHAAQEASTSLIIVAA